MKKTTIRLVFGLLALTYVLTHFLGHAHASSLGIGTNEATVPSTGLFGEWLNWINLQQQDFYRSLTGALKGMREDGSRLWVLIGLSFAYGVFHAAGPGHGKAVISSYMLANEVALRRGIMLSFVSAFLQAITAILVMALVFLVLRGTSVSMTDATWFLEVASYALITLFGAWLLWQKAGPRLLSLVGVNPAYSLSAAHAHPCPRARSFARRPFAWPQPCGGTFARPHRDMTIRTIIRGTITRPTIMMDMRAIITTRARSARPAATATRRIQRCCRATVSAGRRHGRRSPPSACAPAPAR